MKHLVFILLFTSIVYAETPANSYNRIYDVEVNQDSHTGTKVGGNISVDGEPILEVSCSSDGSGGTSDCLVNAEGEVNVAGISSDGTGKGVCIKADGNLGTCTDAVGAGGTCTCN